MGKKVVFDPEACKGCELCIPVCPKDIITIAEEINQQGYHPATVSDENQEVCISCAFCAWICPDLAIEVYRPEGKSRKKAG